MVVRRTMSEQDWLDPTALGEDARALRACSASGVFGLTIPPVPSPAEDEIQATLERRAGSPDASTGRREGAVDHGALHRALAATWGS